MTQQALGEEHDELVRSQSDMLKNKQNMMSLVFESHDEFGDEGHGTA